MVVELIPPVVWGGIPTGESAVRPQADGDGGEYARVLTFPLREPGPPFVREETLPGYGWGV